MNPKQALSLMMVTSSLLLCLSAAASPSAAAPLPQATATPLPLTATLPPAATATLSEPVSSPTPFPQTVLYTTLEPGGQAAGVRYEVSAGEVLIAGILFAQLVVSLVGVVIVMAGRHQRR